MLVPSVPARKEPDIEDDVDCGDRWESFSYPIDDDDHCVELQLNCIGKRRRSRIIMIRNKNF